MASSARTAQALEILRAGGCVRVQEVPNRFGRMELVPRLCRVEGERLIRVPGIGLATLLSDEVRAVLPTMIDKFGLVPGRHSIPAVAPA